MAIIRQQIMDALKLRMQGITYANGYSREVGSKRVYNANKLPQNLPTPSIVILQGPEQVSNNVGDRYECILGVTIGFVDAYAGRDPDIEANEFLADIQTAFTNPDLAFTTTAVGSADSVGSSASILEIANVLNSGDPMDGKVFGEATFEIQYWRSIFTPQKL